MNLLVVNPCHNRLVLNRLKRLSIEAVSELMRQLADEIFQSINELPEDVSDSVHRLREQLFQLDYDVMYQLVHRLALGFGDRLSEQSSEFEYGLIFQLAFYLDEQSSQLKHRSTEAMVSV